MWARVCVPYQPAECMMQRTPAARRRAHENIHKHHAPAQVMRLLNILFDILPPALGGNEKRRATMPGDGVELVADDAAAAAARAELARCDSTLQGEVKGETYVASNHKYAKVRAGKERKKAVAMRLLAHRPVMLRRGGLSRVGRHNPAP